MAVEVDLGKYLAYTIWLVRWRCRHLCDIGMVA